MSSFLYRIAACCLLVFFFCSTNAQNVAFRQKYAGTEPNKLINRVYFLSASNGFAAFSDGLGISTDSGQSYIRRPVLPGNTNFNGYSVNLTFGFSCMGVHAFSQDSILVYGDFGAEPSILFSANGGVNWKLVFHQPFSLNPSIATSMLDMKFFSNTSGTAITQKYLLQTTDRGQNWVIRSQIPLASTSSFEKLSIPTSMRGYAIARNKLYSTANGGGYWSELIYALPNSVSVSYTNLFFTSATDGYIANNTDGTIYRTTNYGQNWTLMNDAGNNPVNPSDLYFINDSTGFASTLYTYNILKTTNKGVNWEVCKKNTNYALNDFGMTNLFFLNSDIGWAAGRGEYLMLTTNSGTPTYPKALFITDTTGLTPSGIVQLKNKSRRNNAYTYEWLVNGVPVASGYDASYNHEVLRLLDTISLIVTNEAGKDTAVLVQNFNVPFFPPPAINSFTPTTGGMGTQVNITGNNFLFVDSVQFGTIPAQSFTVNSATSITAVPGVGTSGDIRVVTHNGSATKSGFMHTGQPSITSFDPQVGGPATEITITGINLNNITSVSFGGVAALSFEILSPLKILAITGNGNSGNVSVSGGNGSAMKPGYKFYAAPVISSVVPAKANVGATVQINGSNFNTSPDGNLVNFGAVKAMIINASATQLTVKVPAGATYSPVSVTANRLIGFSSLPFIVTFGNGIASFQTSSFSSAAPYIGAYKPGTPSLADLDGNGQADIIIGDEGAVSVHRNLSSADTIFLATRVDSLTGGSARASYGDLNGDGKLDVMTANNTGGSGSVLKNTSTPGNISFSRYVNYPLNHIAAAVASGDFNKDGRLDMVVANFDYIPEVFQVSVFKNMSTGDSIHLAPKLDFAVGAGRKGICVADFDGDGKPDIATAAVTVLLNTSTLSTISFSPRLDFSVGTGSSAIACGDIDGDGKIDILTANEASNSVSVLRNISTVGNIAFEPKVDIVVGDFVFSVAITDLDGDGKPDIGINNNPTNTIGGSRLGLVKNRSTAGNLIFAPVILYVAGGGSLTMGDMDGDGKPDIISNTTIFRNRIGAPLSICPNGSTSLVSSLTGTTYQWQQSTDSINYFNIADGGNFSGTTTATLNLLNVPSAWNGRQYRCIVNGNNSEISTIAFSNTWTGAVNNQWENAGNWSCGSVPDAGTDVYVNSGPVIVGASSQVHSLRVRPGVSFTVNTGVILMVQH